MRGRAARTGSRTDDLAAEVASRATDLGWTVGATESLTSGAVSSALGLLRMALGARSRARA